MVLVCTRMREHIGRYPWLYVKGPAQGRSAKKCNAFKYSDMYIYFTVPIDILTLAACFIDFDPLRWRSFTVIVVALFFNGSFASTLGTLWLALQLRVRPKIYFFDPSHLPYLLETLDERDISNAACATRTWQVVSQNGAWSMKSILSSLKEYMVWLISFIVYILTW